MRLTSLLLILTLGFSTVGFGIARGQAPVAGQMVLCTGAGIVTVSIDAEGNPLESHTLCPDAALVFLAATALEAPIAKPLDGSLVWRDWPQDSRFVQAQADPTRSARGPPVRLARIEPIRP